MVYATKIPSDREYSRFRAAPLAMVIPGDSLAEVVIVDGGLNFINIYQGLITLRILLSWFPQAQSIEVLRPLFVVSDA